LHIREFQEMMKHLYLHRDSDRGVAGTYDWLVEEVEELGEALNGSDNEELQKEFADVIAWLTSLANVTGVDLEGAAVAKYNHKCPKCGCSPCKCTF